MTACALREDLRHLGLDCEIESRERLAILRPGGDPSPFAQAETRAAVLRAARARGFTHVALEIDGASHAPVSRD